MVVFYKNSVLASLVSIFGCIFCTAAIYGIIDGIPEMLFMAVIGIPFVFLGKNISKNKDFKKWWQKIESENRVPAIMASVDAAVMAYREYPDNRTLKKIEELNPYAAQSIKNALEANKKNKKG